MIKMKKIAVWMMSVALFAASMGSTAHAAETVAPITAEQLMDAVNVQCAAVNSVHTGMKEAFTMTDASTGQVITATLTSELVQNRAVGHSVSQMKISTKGYSKTETEEAYTAILENVLYTYRLDRSAGLWRLAARPLTKAQLAGHTQPLSISGIETKGAAVTTDGVKFTLTSVISGERMQEYIGMLGASGVGISGGAFPVILEVDAATLLPGKMTVLMNGLSMADAPAITTDVTAVTTFDGFNLYDTFVVPAEVLEKVG